MTKHLFKKPRSITTELERLKKASPSVWEKKGERMIIALANHAQDDLPAYKDYLHKVKLKTRHIKTIDDFRELPLLTKADYLKKADYPQLFFPKTIPEITTVAATSGSTGEPFFFPRGEHQDDQYAYVAEIFLRNQFDIQKKSSLILIGFGLGIWIGGIFTYKCFNKVAQKGYKMALVPAGSIPDTYLKSIKKFGHLYDQIILTGYPPFVKDIVDQGAEYDIDWSKYHVKVMTAAENFSEQYRDYLANKLHIKNIYRDIVNVYGTVELGTMAHETAFTTLIKRLALNKKELYEDLFLSDKQVPTLAQYYPHMVWLEETQGEVVGTGVGSMIPLVRYRFLDRGGVYSYESMLDIMKRHGIDIMKEVKKVEIADTIMKLPFVYVYDRIDNSVVLRGANIYAQNIRDALTQEAISKYLTGKFSMLKKNDRSENPYLEVNVELKKGRTPSVQIKKEIEMHLVVGLRKVNSEYNYLYGADSESVIPKIVLWHYGDPTHFAGGKQRWVKKS